MLSAVSLELGRHDWNSLAACGGTAADLPADLARFLAATTEEVARYYYSASFDNVVVVQGNLYEAAVPLVSVLCAALTEDLPDAARREVIRLIAEIVNADVHYSEVAAGRAGLAERAQELARASLWLFYRELLHGSADDAAYVLDAIETDRNRLELFMAKAKHRLKNFP